MSKVIDLTGQRFGRLTVLRRAENIGIYTAWECLCDCGNKKIIRGFCLKDGSTQSCGCYSYEKLKEANTTHNASKSRLYRIWRNMKSRCNNSKTRLFKHYGGKGVTVCSEWYNFVNFQEWALKNGYKDNLTLDRINGNGNYYPQNCRWSTVKQQNRNKKTNRIIAGKTISEWSELTGIHYNTLQGRIYKGLPIEKVLSPVKPHKKYIARKSKN